MTKTFEYTETHLDAIRAASPIDNETAKRLADDWGIKAASVRAKAVSMPDVVYKRMEPKTKTGEPIEKKADIVEAIAAFVDGDDLESLVKASKPALQSVRDYLVANSN